MAKYQSIIDSFKQERLIDDDVYHLLKTLSEDEIKHMEFPRNMKSLIHTGLTETQLLEMQTSTILCSLEIPADPKEFKEVYRLLKEHYEEKSSP